MKYFLFAVSAALIIATSSIGLVAQSPPKAPRFEVDPNWPQIPNNWVLGADEDLIEFICQENNLDEKLLQ